MVFLTTAHGKPRSHRSFSQWFSKACSDADLMRFSAHGLRKYRMNELSENGASVLQMQAWVGHATLDEIEQYTRKAQRRTAFLGTEQDQNPVKQSNSKRKHCCFSMP
ncbi:tyrosine-type recombinase/integrase [Parasedimentitalea huanghaiensis]|uniref:tyrosine-type recombinase/integrase n=1 Tax=Parasedimentitalea huanghaiensis TaxID=2682100 RepID=UPI001FD793E1|nr:tyrosine-type recombinase/integrase [Zongyanglinia huanghaiensis]